ncbi:fatty acid synthesis protein [Histophilus somni]|uniref:fatty acid synthesis protein n=1 Tax=Histophilus somni TaxID=731 RepID=UPI00201F7763|nr:fatty acid synthesis protein [Histophilus somni]
MSPRITICELVKALGRYPMLSLLFANNQQIFPLRQRFPIGSQNYLAVCHCSHVIKNNQCLVHIFVEYQLGLFYLYAALLNIGIEETKEYKAIRDMAL